MSQPNILFLLPDQHRPDWAGGPQALEGLYIATPNLDRLRSMGTTITDAYTVSAVCAPSRACLASGMTYGRAGVLNNHQDYPLELPTYYQTLQDSGYRVAGVGKFDLHKNLSKPLDWGLDGSRLIKEWGFTEGIDNEGKLDGVRSYEENQTPKGPYFKHLQDHNLADDYVKMIRTGGQAKISNLPQESYCDTWIARNGLQFLENFPQNQPWHLVVNFAGPHDPFDVTDAMLQTVEGRQVPQPHSNEDRGEAMDIHMLNRQYYTAMVEHIDHLVGEFIKAVEKRGELNNTIIVYSSDHGEMMGDHGKYGKSTWEQASIGIPMIVAGPNVRKNMTIKSKVYLHDLAATFLDYAGAQHPSKMDAKSLRPLLEGQQEQIHDVIVSGLHLKHRYYETVYDGRYKFANDNGEVLLFDLQSDPKEEKNIINEQPELLIKLKQHSLHVAKLM